jgi:hypothetical protein
MIGGQMLAYNLNFSNSIIYTQKMVSCWIG